MIVAAILRDARLRRSPQDEGLFRGEILDPHGEERRLRRVSNHEADTSAAIEEPYAMPGVCRRGKTLHILRIVL
jgi:hypothetical protein